MSQLTPHDKFSKEWEHYFTIFTEYTTERGGKFELGIRTSASYLFAIKRFVTYLQVKELHEVTAIDFKDYVFNLNRNKNKESYINFTIAAIKSAFELWYSLGIIEVNKISEVVFPSRARKGKRKKSDSIEEKSIPPDVIRKILNAIEHADKRWDMHLADRDWLIIAIGYASGLREFELANIHINKIDFEKNGVTVIRKGDEELFVYITDLLKLPYKKDIELIEEFKSQNTLSDTNPDDLALIDAYAKEHNIVTACPQIMTKIQQYISAHELAGDDTLFGIKEGAIWYRIKHWIQKAYADQMISTHWLRHSFGTHLSAVGVSAFTLMALMNHKDIKTTERYVHLKNEDTSETLKGLNLYKSLNAPLIDELEDDE